MASADGGQLCVDLGISWRMSAQELQIAAHTSCDGRKKEL
jgi:hypothetical protein